MNVRYLLLLTMLAFLGFSVTAMAHPCPVPSDGHKHCDQNPGTDDPAEYTAELTSGDFVFASGTMEGLTANRKGTGLPGNGWLEMDPGIENGWDYIFEDCAALLTNVGVNGFDVQDDNWSIHYTKSRRGLDKIHITMRNLRIHPGTSEDYSQVDFDLDLHGEIASGEPFLPESGGVSEFTLTKYKLWAGGRGDEGWFICNSEGGGWDDWPELNQDSVLEITRE